MPELYHLAATAAATFLLLLLRWNAIQENMLFVILFPFPLKLTFHLN